MGATPHVLWFHQLSRRDADTAGGKGANLGELTAAGLPVPPGFVIPTHTFASYLSEANLSANIGTLLARIAAGGDTSAIGADICARFFEAPAPSFAADIVAAYDQLGRGPVAVRSSATAEDTADASFAGQQSTFLNIEGADRLIDAVRGCWASLYEPRAISYRGQCGIDHATVTIATVVQQMVQSERSGVAFTIDPVTHSHDTIVIEAVRGLGEALVSGEVTPDMYAVDKATLAIRDRTIVEQHRELVRCSPNDNGGEPNAWRDVSAVKRTRPKLNDDEITRLAEIVRRVEEHYGAPQDIEWAEAGGQFYIVQSRPVTTLQHTH